LEAKAVKVVERAAKVVERAVKAVEARAAKAVEANPAPWRDLPPSHRGEGHRTK
jgi:hypothetical protein